MLTSSDYDGGIRPDDASRRGARHRTSCAHDRPFRYIDHHDRAIRTPAVPVDRYAHVFSALLADRNVVAREKVLTSAL